MQAGVRKTIEMLIALAQCLRTADSKLTYSLECLMFVQHCALNWRLHDSAHFLIVLVLCVLLHHKQDGQKLCAIQHSGK